MDDDDETFAPIRKSWQAMSGIPVGSDARRNAARKQTAKGKKVSKRIGAQTGGLRKRRNKKGFGDGHYSAKEVCDEPT